MKIYAVADLHGKKDRIDRVKAVIQKKHPDVLVIAGDITNYIFPGRTCRQLDNISIPIFCVTGNSDFWPAKKKLNRLNHVSFLDSNPSMIEDISFVGLNGTIVLPFVSKVSFSETKKINDLQDIVTPETILVAHPPPRGICDKAGGKVSVGSFGIKQIIDMTPPLILICGHVHEQAGYFPGFYSNRIPG